MDVPARARVASAPAATKAGLLATLVLVGAGLVFFEPARAGVYLLLLTALFLVRVAGQLVVVSRSPAWLPPMEQWNFVPYRILLPIQVVLLTAMAAGGQLVLGGVRPGPGLGAAFVWCSVAYWAAMGVRYARRMSAHPDQRWFGGAIPIVFHCVLAAYLFVLGSSGAAS
jgi:hypothetical protein